ncbi:hypothetical protein GME_09089 [Halomonas sp. TD01]|nr:hypothetical protein GME_09089 [Halomonas sp. TD01]
MADGVQAYNCFFLFYFQEILHFPSNDSQGLAAHHVG